MAADKPESLSSIYFPLRLAYGLTPLIAGVDKFFNLLTDWSGYLPGDASSVLPVSTSTFMHVVGCIEIVAGLAVLTKFTRLGAYVVMAWLILIAATLVVGGHLDVAVRDLVMAVGAFALGRAAAYRHEAWLPFGWAARPTESYAHAR
ncbi:DoxX family membrane protein [Planctomyces sp. SH-PL62]|uniref:DoxX family membrane protein n=1 Tax=Planctomyces sp. SH-PL62 TaxID=1636152 RepID=UPI00078D6BF6|nr:DoxX family membrane protein [Planctomyces sp. SH-PL62]AMV36882.1 DoxX [Planctomyces sp. SH-PL62]